MAREINTLKNSETEDFVQQSSLWNDEATCEQIDTAANRRVGHLTADKHKNRRINVYGLIIKITAYARLFKQACN